MTKHFSIVLAASCAAAAFAGPTSAASAKKVMMYEATKCHMLYTPAQAKTYHYVCPGSHSKMKMVMVTPAAKVGMMATAKELAGAKKKS